MMSIKDELDRAAKEKELENIRIQDVLNKKRKTLIDLLDEKFNNFSRSLLPYIIPLTDSVKSFRVIEALFDLRNACNLTYYLSNQSQDYNHELRAKISCELVPIELYDNYQGAIWPWGLSLSDCKDSSDKVDYYRKYFSIRLRSVIYYPTIYIDEPAIEAASLVDFKNEGCYVDRLAHIDHAIMDFPDFDLVTQGFRESLNILRLAKIKNLTVKLTWALYTQRGGYSDPDVTNWQEIQIAIRPDLTSISRRNGITASIATNECTSSWIQQQIANVYIKHS